MNEGYIKIFRSLLDWEWYDDINTKVLFLHLLLKANYQEKKWRGIVIEKGELITSLDNLSEETGLSVMKIRTCLKKLKLTNEITNKTTNNFTLIKLNNYLKYNGDNTPNNISITNKQQTDNKQVTTTKERKEYKENNKLNKFNLLQKKENFSKKNKKEISREIIETGVKKDFGFLFKTEILENLEFLENLKNKFGIENEDLKVCAENFIIFWTEKNPNGKKEKWEKEKTFDLRRRFYTWVSNYKNWNHKKTKQQTASYETVF